MSGRAGFGEPLEFELEGEGGAVNRGGSPVTVFSPSKLIEGRSEGTHRRHPGFVRPSSTASFPICPSNSNHVASSSRSNQHLVLP